MGLFARSLFPASALRKAIASIVPTTQFEYLRIPLTVTATDLDSGELLLLGGRDRRGQDIELADALYASCALPLYFPPLEADGRRLGEGGLRAVLPIEAARIREPDADVFVAVDVGPGFDERVSTKDGPRPSPLPNVVRVHGEALR